MSNPFGTAFMASGYARSRPPVHVEVLREVSRTLKLDHPVDCALDIGCGSGISAQALAPYARNCIGIEPVEAMLQYAHEVAPQGYFVAGLAEALPVRNYSVDIVSAAGSLNYSNLDLFFPEAARVLKPQGVLVVYDFSPGRSFVGDGNLDEWFGSFMARYPSPVAEGRDLSPEILAGLAPGFRIRSSQRFEIGLPLEPGFYLDYVMTETNVAAAIRSSIPEAEIRCWCETTLSRFWTGAPRTVLFRGYFACLAKA